VAEVGVLRVDGGVAALAAGPAEGRDLMHLLDERGLVLLLGLGEGVAQLEQLGVEVLQLLGGGLRLAGEAGLDLRRMSILLGDDALAVAGRALGPALVNSGPEGPEGRQAIQARRAVRSIPRSA
jgi:hypothetical protein